MRKLTLSSCAVVFAVILSSCSATTSGEAVKKSLTNINEELVIIQKSLTDTQTSVEDIQSVNANIQADIATNADSIAELRSEIAYLNNEILVLKGGKGATAAASENNKNKELNNIVVLDNKEQAPAPQIVVIEDSGAAKNSIYSYAIELNRQKKYTEARAKFQEFLRKYPKDQLAGNAQYWIGETYYSINDMNNALKAFQDVLNKFPKSNKIPDAMLKIGYVQEKQGKTREAINTLNNLLSKYPKSRPAGLARQKLQSLGA